MDIMNGFSVFVVASVVHLTEYKFHSFVMLQDNVLHI